MKTLRICLLLAIMCCMCTSAIGQTKKSTKPAQWKTIVDDGNSTISFDQNITTDKRGNHIVWVKTVFHTTDWQQYFAQQIGSRSLVYSTRTKAMYNPEYKYVMVRQVMCYNKAGKLLYNSGDDTSAGWGPVNASDPVGIVGEYLWDLNNDNPY